VLDVLRDLCRSSFKVRLITYGISLIVVLVKAPNSAVDEKICVRGQCNQCSESTC